MSQRFRGVILAVLGAALAGSSHGGIVEPPFTYQGELAFDGVRVTALCDVQLSLHALPDGGLPIVPAHLAEDVAVVDGRFAVEVQGWPTTVWSGDRWLEIAVGCPAGGALTTLSPRTRITSAPSAAVALSVPAGSIGAAEVDDQAVQLRVNGTCAAGSSIREIAADGTVTCDATTGSTFTGLTDTPDVYAANGSALVRVNAAENALEFVSASALAVGDASTLDGLDSSAFAAVSHAHDGGDITTGVVPQSRIDAAVARDNEVLGIVLANDGAGSGLDADLVDGTSSASFLRTDASSTVAAGNTLTVNGALTANGNLTVANLIRGADTITDFSGSGLQVNAGSLGLTSTGVAAGTYGNATNVPQLTVDAQGRISGVTNVAVVAANANTLDGLDSAQFLRSDTDTTYSSGTLTVGSGASLAVDDAADFRVVGALANGAGGKIAFGDQILGFDQVVLDHSVTNTLRIEALAELRLEASSAGAQRITLTPGTGGARVEGNLDVTGTLSKGAGSFDIVHPDPARAQDGWRLRHAFVESPTRGDNLYRYRVTVRDGTAEIALPDYFAHLNEDAQVWVSPVGHFGAAYGELNAASTVLAIRANADGDYNVLLVATRKDGVARDFWDEKGVEYQP